MKKFDLTTIKGSKLAKAYAESIRFSPIGLVYSIGEKIFTRNERVERLQREMASELISKGGKEGVDEMEITVDNHTGLKFNAPVDEGIDVNCEIGAGDKMTIKVKYK